MNIFKNVACFWATISAQFVSCSQKFWIINVRKEAELELKDVVLELPHPDSQETLEIELAEFELLFLSISLIFIPKEPLETCMNCWLPPANHPS